MVVVWGLVIYKIIAALNPELPDLAAPLLSGLKVESIKRDSFSFTMTKLDRDPFLGTISKQDTFKIVKAQSIIPKNNIEVTYKGVIMPSSKEAAIFILQIKNRERLLKVGQSVDSVTLVKGNASSVTIKYNHIVRQIPIKA